MQLQAKGQMVVEGSESKSTESKLEVQQDLLCKNWV